MARQPWKRVALALESARLLDDAQKRAQRETFLSEVSTKLGASFQVDSILRDTVEELGQTFQERYTGFLPTHQPASDNGNNGSPSRKNGS
ncbi:MAG: hypothetical protein U0V48_16360 [Anaerolineales bacterium]